LNQRNAHDYKKETQPEGKLYYVDPKTMLNTLSKRRRRRKKAPVNINQLSLFGDL